MHPWTFPPNHAIVFIALASHPLITGQALSSLIGITGKSVRNIVSDLESGGYIKKSKEGRQLKYKINPNSPFRNQIQGSKAIAILLEALGWKPKRKRAKA
ncbi:MAG: hypothetical protein A2162_05275 [Deltaproteobacteria bacterium RBG_13_52_11b]|nr:MAG: hypothetical protein A2162_05275 [Deltaproteobacteria bacterium RBG_13_52_11b]